MKLDGVVVCYATLFGINLAHVIVFILNLDVYIVITCSYIAPGLEYYFLLFQMLFSGTTPRTQEVGYTLLWRPITVPGLQTALQPTST